MRHCWRSKDELISDVVLWTPSHGRASLGRPTRTYIQQFCTDTVCSQEDLLEAIDERDERREREREREREKSVQAAWQDDDDDDVHISFVYIYIYRTSLFKTFIPILSSHS